MPDRNANRPGYKPTPVGWIPEEWECVPLGTVFTKRDQPGTNGMPVFSVTMDRGLVRRDTIDRKMAPDVPSEESLLVEPGDIAYNMMRMWQGAMALCANRGVVSPAYIVCRPREGRTDPLFMYHYFKSHPGLYRLWAYSYGITGDRLRLYFEDFGLVPAPLPPLAEQRRIAGILATWDEALTQTRQRRDAARDCKRALMQQLLTGELRIPQFNGMPWRTCRLGELFTEREEVNRPDLPLLAITATEGIVLASELDRKDASNADKTLYRCIRPGDIGYNTMRMWQGVSAVSTLEGIVSPAYTVCTPNDEVDVHFMGYLLKFPDVVHRLWRNSQGLVDDTLNLKFHHFAQIAVSVPAVAEQRAIAAILATADAEVRLLDEKLAALDEQKRGLMQKLLTGEVRV